MSAQTSLARMERRHISPTDMTEPRPSHWTDHDSPNHRLLPHENQPDHQADNSIEQKRMYSVRPDDDPLDRQLRPSKVPCFPESSAPTSPATVLAKQPATRPITEQQLINEVKGIYAGLVMVERKCVDIINHQDASNKRINDQQWKALVALHRTLLQEHHDFFSASQHPTVSQHPTALRSLTPSENLKKLAIKHVLPARMWRNGIHAFLELLRHRLPESMEHMLSFIYLAYSMMVLLKESLPSFVETWIECLGDLARYRMAIEDTDHRDREIWSNVAKMWYNEAADKCPDTGRIQHHLAVLECPDTSEPMVSVASALILDSIRLVASQIGEEDTTPCTRVDHALVRHVPANPWDLFFTVSALTYVESCISWAAIVSFLNTPSRSGVSYAGVEVDGFPPTHGGHQKHLPEDFIMRGTTSVRHYYPPDFFAGSLVDEDERQISVLNIRRPATVVLGQTAENSAGFDWLYSKIRRWSRSVGKLLSLTWAISMIALVNALPIEVVDNVTKSNTSISANSTGWKILLYSICAILTIVIPILGPKFTVKDATHVSSLVAFMSALAMSVNSDHDFPYLWGALCTGVSLGCSLWLLRTTKADQKSILIAIGRYLVPAAAIWRLLSNSDLSGHDRQLDLSKSIPCLSAFGAVFLNALVNEQFRAIHAGLRSLRERILSWLELAPIAS